MSEASSATPHCWHYCLNHPSRHATPPHHAPPRSMEKFLPRNRSLVPKRLGTADTQNPKTLVPKQTPAKLKHVYRGWLTALHEHCCRRCHVILNIDFVTLRYQYKELMVFHIKKKKKKKGTLFLVPCRDVYCWWLCT